MNTEKENNVPTPTAVEYVLLDGVTNELWEVDYENGIVPDDKYWGDIQRDATLSTVLKVLEMSGLKFRIEGKKVTVIKGNGK